MHDDLVEILACPSCGGALSANASERRGDVIAEGELRCGSCERRYAIARGIARFVPSGDYAGSFGFQWNRFKLEQLDSANGTTLSADRFFAETGWSREWLSGRTILDAGCGAGRFLDVATRSGARVVGVDLSSAVDAAADTLADRERLDLVQASIDALPFRTGAFDGVYCIGVIQHTSDPETCVRALARVLRPGGRIAITAYERRRWTMLYGKYWARRLTRGLSDQALYRLISLLMPIAFPITELLFRVPLAGRFFRFVIPIANYTDAPLSVRQRYRWALLDTFDMLAPAYDQPQRFESVSRWLAEERVTDVRRGANAGLNVVGRKPDGTPA
ncbi:MAG TPA: methyltransferase domain-containing protein [Candidatus Limnocylindria bacterium]|nr:methyltransferase domain-containing protein [Candidatus Limnocylindria bacterium]